jgi:Fe-S-cluster containining protein
MAETDCTETAPIIFICEKCGECCRHIELFVEMMPHQHNGVCNYLKGDLCSVYEHRPDLCDYKRAYKYFNAQWTENEYRDNVNNACARLRKNKKKSAACPCVAASQ